MQWQTPLPTNWRQRCHLPESPCFWLVGSSINSSHNNLTPIDRRHITRSGERDIKSPTRESGALRLNALASNEIAHRIAMYEVLMFAQLLAQDSSFQQWVDSRPPAELCQLYSDKMIPDSMLPGGRDSSPCGTETFDNPMNYVVK